MPVKKYVLGVLIGFVLLISGCKDEQKEINIQDMQEDVVSQNEKIEKHAQWVEKLRSKYDTFTSDNVMSILEEEVGQVFVQVLEDAGVYKCTPEGRAAFKKFIATL